MWRFSGLCFLIALVTTANADGLYTKKSPVLQVDAKTYDSLIAKSNHTSIVEFYAPWCGHCQNLKPAFEKAAKNLAGLAKVAAVNCDEESNKPLCGTLGVKGFPTLKIIRPSAKSGKPTIEDYQGERSAKAIVTAVVDKIPNHVKRVSDKNLSDWLSEKNDTAKAILFTEKGTTSALLRALAVDFLSQISFAQIRSRESASVDTFGITDFPTLILLPGGDKDGLVYDGEMKKASMLTFLTQVAQPNPDPAPKAAKPSKSAKAPKASSSSAASSFSKASASHQASEASEAAASATAITVEDSAPTESPDPKVPVEEAPIQLPEVTPTLRDLDTAESLAKTCLGAKTTTCVLLLLPPMVEQDAVLPDAAAQALISLAELSHKHHKRSSNFFPIHSVPATVSNAAVLRKNLGLSDADTEILAVNGRRSWWRPYKSGSFTTSDIETWLDAIRLGEGEKHRLPDGIVVTEPAPPTESEPEHDEL